MNKRIVDGNFDASLAVKCINGTFVGKRVDGVIDYRGIPFVGAQPVGDLRWKAPVDYAADDGVYEAYENAKSPWQVAGVAAMAGLGELGEDCLYLNVFKSDDASSEKKPVMVWIHGGAFEVDGVADPMCDCHNLVEENPDVIVCAVEYRLGVFGFFHLSHLADGADYPDAQNLGLMDQLQALKWIHENIAAFGGDPDRVTIFGESAGGASVTLLPLLKGSKGRIRRVIAQSGTPTFTRSVEQAISCTDELMGRLGCKTVADLRNIAVEDLIAAADGMLTLRVFPERDGDFVPLDPFGEYERGTAAGVDILTGCNKDEMGYFINSLGLEGYDAFAQDRLPKKLEQFTEEERKLACAYLEGVAGATPEYTATSRLFDQIEFIAPAFRIAENQVAAGGSAHVYFFTPESSLPLIKCGHAVEIPCVFNHPEATIFTGRAFDATFSKTLRRMWVQFALCGDPSLSAEMSPDGKEKVWPAYDRKDRQVMVFDEFDIHAEKESEREIVDWEKTYFMTKYYTI